METVAQNAYPMLGWFTGVGSRETPRDVCDLFTAASYYLSRRGWALRSGGASGADLAFEHGAQQSPRWQDLLIEIWLPQQRMKRKLSETEVEWLVADGVHYFDGSQNPYWAQAQALARSIHPAPERLNEYSLSLHSRNCFQALGSDLKSPSKSLLCWAPIIHKRDGTEDYKGGTRTAIVLAKQNNIPVINAFKPEDRARIEAFVRTEERIFH